MSADGIKAKTTNRRNPPITSSVIKTVIFVVIAPGTVTVVLPYYLMGRRVQIDAPLGLVGLLPLALGVVIALRCFWDFASTGRGTPAPIDPPKILVARGFYRYVRNPMDVGLALILLGESMLFGSVTLLEYALVVWLLFHFFVVFYEEPPLRRKFRASYVEYCTQVGRWMPTRVLSSQSSAISNPKRTQADCQIRETDR